MLLHTHVRYIAIYSKRDIRIFPMCAHNRNACPAQFHCGLPIGGIVKFAQSARQPQTSREKNSGSILIHEEYKGESRFSSCRFDRVEIFIGRKFHQYGWAGEPMTENTAIRVLLSHSVIQSANMSTIQSATDEEQFLFFIRSFQPVSYFECAASHARNYCLSRNAKEHFFLEITVRIK